MCNQPDRPNQASRMAANTKPTSLALLAIIPKKSVRSGSLLAAVISGFR